MKIQGWDISLNHAGIVEFTDGVLSNFWYVTRKKSIYKRLGVNGYLLDIAKSEDPHIESIVRLNVWRDLLDRHIDNTKPEYVGIEDYAYGKAMRAHQIGEIGGLARMACFNKGVMLRLHDPLSIKMFVTGNGLSKKDAMVSAVKNKWGISFSNYDSEKGTEVQEDLADAFGICMLIKTEIDLRNGTIQLKDLNEKEIKVFNRCTKTFPISLLGRDWIHRG